MVENFRIYQHLALHHHFSQQHVDIKKRMNTQHMKASQHIIEQHQQKQLKNLKNSLKYVYKNTYKLLTQQDHNNNIPIFNNPQNNISTFNNNTRIFNNPQHSISIFNNNPQHNNSLLPHKISYNNNLNFYESETELLTTKCLPPCRICNDKASGFHYGLNTCEACKVGG